MWQFTNHIPKASSICRKDTLARYLRCMRKVYGSVYDFSPSVYNLPLEYNKLVAECSRNRTTAHEDDDVWICKPVGLSQGRGIYLFRRLSELTYDTNTIVQRYIRNPLLIGGYKCDLRLYVCVTSYHPLAIYLYREGLVRFSTDKFSLNDLDNPFCHLTNCSLNKMGPGYFEKKDRVGSVGHGGLAAVAARGGHRGADGADAGALHPQLAQLLRVNLSPALGNDCDVDPAVKKPMLHDLFDLLGLPVRNTGLSLFTMWDSPAAPQPAALTQRAAGSRPPRGAQAAGDPTLAV
ncbi:Tubulin glycylase 3A, partial [Gryllus bimaculatus]